MIKYNNGGCLVQCNQDLPNLVGADDVFIDFETSSGDPKLDALNPWHHCKAMGICITVDDISNSWYVPYDRTDTPDIEPSMVVAWLRDIMMRCKRWINHNVKYDAHVCANSLNIVHQQDLVDTVTLAKIIDSDRMLRGGYSLKALSKGWLNEDIGYYENSLAPYLYKNKDYGAIPTDIIGEYGCQDALTARRLWKYIDGRCPDQCRDVWNTEIALTKVLFHLERKGVRIDPQELLKEEYLILARLLAIDEELTRIVGRSFQPHVNADCYEVLCGTYGLPVLGFTKTNNPSFDKITLAAYAVHPDSPNDVLDLMLEYRQLRTLLGLFVVPYQTLHIDGRLHPSYNQTVRTGRMSCRRPNQQQLSSRAKSLVHPDPGCAFLSIDYSQIEFRLIVHYINDRDCIAAYEANARTDFHQWIADMIPMARRPAKNVNFMMGYGGGRAKCVAMLSANKDVVGGMKDIVRKLLADGKISEAQFTPTLEYLCKQKGDKVYGKYHATLPGLKHTTYKTAQVLKQRGYVYNLYGRHRHLPRDVAHKAFNTLCQSSAADLMKECTVAVAPICESAGINIVGSVHDELLFEGPIDILSDRTVQTGLAWVMERPTARLRVPICVDVGFSTVDWKLASADGKWLESTPIEYRNARTWLRSHGYQGS